MGEASKGQRASPINRIILKTASSAKIQIRSKSKITKRTHFLSSSEIYQSTTSNKTVSNQPQKRTHRIAPARLTEVGRKRIATNLGPLVSLNRKERKRTCALLRSLRSLRLISLNHSTHCLSTSSARYKCQPIPTLATGIPGSGTRNPKLETYPTRQTVWSSRSKQLSSTHGDFAPRSLPTVYNYLWTHYQLFY